MVPLSQLWQEHSSTVECGHRQEPGGSVVKPPWTRLGMGYLICMSVLSGLNQ